MAEAKPKSKAEKCGDVCCPTHGKLKTRGQVFTGRVISDKMQKTVNVEWGFLRFVPKYERYEKRRTRVKAHVTPCLEAKQGDTVRIAECRPISKAVKFVVFEKVK